MNITIEEFTQADYDGYLNYAIDSYAEANVKSGRWTMETARSEAQKQFDSLLKDGLKSKGHVFWKICLDGKKVGDFWFYRNPEEPGRIFVYDVMIVKEYQGQGIGTFSFSIIQKRLKALGVSKIGLHVFAHNTGAIRLYERLGFKYTSHNMHYTLDN